MRGLRRRPLPEIPYPPVFHDWQFPDRRVATTSGVAGPGVDMYLGDRMWKRVDLTETDACLMAASLLQRAEREDLAQKVLEGMR